MMRPTLFLVAVLPFVTPVFSSAETCQEIASKVTSASDVIYALHPNFLSDIHHWYISSSQTPSCVFEPGSAEDLATAVQIIGSARTPFAVRSGGHASNPGFSSTTGVHISLNRLDQVVLSDDNSTVTIGTGLTWVDVYKKLEKTGYNVVGGRTVGPGIGGFTLGGGFSWKTNQYGLTCDTVKSFTLVLPNGTITQVDEDKPDLFFALKGGLNRFGIVVSAEFYTHQQSPQVYGGLALYGNDKLDAVLEATAKFDAESSDPKAQIITTLEGSALTGTTALVLFFYDGPTKPESFGLFDNITATLDTTRTQTFAEFVQGFPSNLITNARGTFHTFSTSKLTPGFVNAVRNETDTLGKVMASHSGTSISYDIEPFLKTYGEKATDSAYPHANSPLPLNLYFAWLSPADDEFWYNAMRSSIETLRTFAINEGIYSSDFTAYPNYAISNTTAEDLYGATNAERLRSIRSQVDPDGIMELAGGFSI
ncbi:FAD linked oxidase [Lasiodiplodia theobromae]|uniref:Putative FAD-linked oxidoreductprotein n=1 Tax=Lasiodiplodia theobromae TaxID=45133 RepID=A0A5N5DF98_9PEZI|nr:FAD linked oxidase [Lasiodiplodia theobromae]KAB2576489.1 putative FAD-linked oxidoreductprotein [Lasiodiplodia theobromae]KAF4546664.1 FAD linked oxidase [Lasiodiplodia theobromae]